MTAIGVGRGFGQHLPARPAARLGRQRHPDAGHPRLASRTCVEKDTDATLSQTREPAGPSTPLVHVPDAARGTPGQSANIAVSGGGAPSATPLVAPTGAANAGTVYLILSRTVAVFSRIAILIGLVAGGFIAALALFGTVAASGVRSMSAVPYEGNQNLVIVALSLSMGIIPIAVPASTTSARPGSKRSSIPASVRPR